MQSPTQIGVLQGCVKSPEKSAKTPLRLARDELLIFLRMSAAMLRQPPGPKPQLDGSVSVRLLEA